METDTKYEELVKIFQELIIILENDPTLEIVDTPEGFNPRRARHYLKRYNILLHHGEL